MRVLGMRLLYRTFLLLVALIVLVVAGICGWLFGYTGDLPDFDHLSQFAPSVQSTVSDSCLASPSTAIPFDRFGKPLQDALVTAESEFRASLSDYIAGALLCNNRVGWGNIT